MTQAKHKNHGGKRPGAGRPKGVGKFGEPTKPIRIPESLIGDIERYIQKAKADEFDDESKIPLYACKVAAGFPSPADDFLEGTLDLNNHLVKHPAATFFVRVTGESMLQAGIHPDDILIVDRSLRVTSGKIVIAVLNGELTVKRYVLKGSQVILMPENTDFKPIIVPEDAELQIWGVVTNVIHAL